MRASDPPNHPPPEVPLYRFERWLRASSRSDATIRLRMRYVRALHADVHVLDVTRDDLEALLAARRHLAPETRKSMVASWRLFYGWALDRGLISDDPTRRLDSVRVPARVPRIAPDAAVRDGIRGASTRDRAMILLARYACLRLSEVARAHTRDRDGDRLRVLGKGGKERLVHLNEPLLFTLRALEREQGDGYYLPGASGGHMHPMSVNKVITRLTGCNPHSLRHAGATAAYRATGDLRSVQAMLGHASMATTQRYLHLNEDAMRRVAAATEIAA